MASDWYIQVMGEAQGPLTAAQVKQLARIGQIVPDTPMRRGTSGAWVAADQVQGLFAPGGTMTPKPAPPPVQPPQRNGAPPRVPDPEPVFAVSKVKAKAAQHPRRGFFDWILYAIDPMFRRYLTPWIIRYTWGLVLLAAVLAVGLFVFVDGMALAQAKPDMSEVEQAYIEFESARRNVEALEEIEGRYGRRSDRRPAESSEPERPRQPQQPEKTAKEYLAEAKQRLAAAERRLTEAKAQVEPKWQAALKLLPGQAMWFALQMIACTLAVLWLRVLLESGIVLFNIVTKLGSIDDRLAVMNRQETGPAPPPAEPVASTA